MVLAKKNLVQLKNNRRRIAETIVDRVSER
jgi:hypothetical protein